MAGAYVAKPDIPPSVPVYPAIPFGWPSSWTHPGPPIPPGYSPSYQIVLSSPSAVSPGTVGNVAQSTCLWGDYQEYDATTWKAGLPLGDDQVQVWSATLDGSPLRLKIDGGAFDDSLVFSYSESGGWYGVHNQQIVFDIDRDNFGGTIILSSETTIDGEDYDDIEVITVGSVKITGVVTGSDSLPSEGAVVTFTSDDTAQEEQSVTDASGEYEVNFTLDEDAGGYTVNVSHASEDDDIDMSVDSKGELGDYTEDFEFGAWWARMYLSTKLSPDGTVTLSTEDGDEFVIATSGLTIAISSATGIFSDYEISYGEASAEGRVWTASLLWELTQEQWASLDGDTLTHRIQCEGIDTDPYVYNEVESRWSFRVYDSSGVQQQLATANLDEPGGPAASFDRQVDAFSIADNIITVLHTE